LVAFFRCSWVHLALREWRADKGSGIGQPEQKQAANCLGKFNEDHYTPAGFLASSPCGHLPEKLCILEHLQRKRYLAI
jgi:hypothetical protein